MESENIHLYPRNCMNKMQVSNHQDLTKWKCKGENEVKNEVSFLADSKGVGKRQ